LCSVPSVFSCTYRRLDGDNKVKNYLCYLIPHTTKSLIFPNALHFIPALITCMELFVCPQNHESLLTTIRLVCITKVLQEYATFMMIILIWRKHWFFGGYFSHIDWHAYSLAHTDNHKGADGLAIDCNIWNSAHCHYWIDWVRQWFWVESNVLHASVCTAGRSWDSKSCDLESRAKTMVAP